MAVLVDFLHQLVFWHHTLKAVADNSEDDVPQASTNGGVEDEVREFHLGQTGGDADEVAYARHETANECSHSTVVIEILFGFLHFQFKKSVFVSAQP